MTSDAVPEGKEGVDLEYFEVRLQEEHKNK